MSALECFERLSSVCATLRRETEDRPFVLGCSGSLLARWFIPRLDRLQRELPELRLQLSASQGEPARAQRREVDATLLFADPPWPSDMQVFERAPERIGPVLSPRYANHAQLSAASADALYAELLLHTTCIRRPGRSGHRRRDWQPERLQLGQGFEHLYYLLEAAAAGLGVAIAPQTLVADDLRAGRLVAPWTSSKPRAVWRCTSLHRSAQRASGAVAA